MPGVVPPMEQPAEKNYGIQSNIKILLGKDCKVEKIMNFLREIEIFEEI